MDKLKKHTISVLVENKFGVLAHISGLFSARGFNINSLAVGETEDPTISRITIVVAGDDRTLEQVVKQLNRLFDVIKVEDLTNKDFIDRELLLIKVRVNLKDKGNIKSALELLPAEIIDEKKESVIIQACGSKKEIKDLFKKIGKYEIKEIVRTGKIALVK